ncbi:PREDICTED: uncharacterized protein LOC108783928 [Nanorana parkeri]|uniref:uncharacterized protein LOC108783928 n=1 Tax=Nanorana parkeri TaxID=125878 RepID=UPI00085476C7|nr:PREDICTED: uncharacterized protein LOC108783928 [Nanorana parkeri]
MDFFNKLTRSNSTKKKKPASDQVQFEEEENVKCVTAIIVGAGSRGFVYSFYAVNFPKRMKVVGVADPRSCVRDQVKKYHEIDDDNFFEDWKEAAEREKFADAVIITTPDRLHKEPAIAFAKKGYHILLEKPMAVTPEDCCEIVSTCKENGVMLAVGHVLRYHPVSIQIKELIDSGVIGDIVHIQHLEPVGFWHFAHSFVRGNWRNESESTFSLLAKSCHDIDLICYWMGKQRCVKVSSFGALSHFTKENKPSGASSRCLDCAVENSCPYSAKKIYLNKGHFGWPVSVVCSNGVYDIESLTEALRTGPYGRCVYDCDNDVCTNQVVNMEFEGGKTAAFTMMGFTYALGVRNTTIFGTKLHDVTVWRYQYARALDHLFLYDIFIPLVFLLAVTHKQVPHSAAGNYKPFLRTVRANVSIQGVQTGPVQHKVAAFADDLLFFLASPDVSLPLLLSEIERYGKISNFLVNSHKSMAMRLSLTGPRLWRVLTNFPFKWSPTSLKYLGIQLPKNPSLTFSLNFPPLLTAISLDLKKWSTGTFSWMGRCNILKQTILPRLLYPLQALPIKIPSTFFRTLRTLFTKFVWAGKPPRINYNILRLPKHSGGMGLPDEHLYYIATHLTRMLDWSRHATSKLWTGLEQSLTTTPLSGLAWSSSPLSPAIRSHPTIMPTLVVARSAFSQYSISPYPSPMVPVLGNPAV